MSVLSELIASTDTKYQACMLGIIESGKSTRAAIKAVKESPGSTRSILDTLEKGTKVTVETLEAID